MILPENMINFMTYLEGRTLIGTANVDLPSLDSLSEKVKGAGIAGEVEAAILGHFASFALGISWRTIQPEAVALAAPTAHNIEFRGSQQIFNAGSGTISTQPVKVTCIATPKKTSLGKMLIGGQTDTKNEFEVSYIRVTIDGNVIVEIDKYNFICIINGIDYLASVRSDMGLSS